MTTLMIEKTHLHTWVATDGPTLMSENYGLMRIEESCDCGAFRVRIVYTGGVRPRRPF